MSSVRLSTTSYVVLGMIALRGPSTSYDLKRAIGRSVGYFWTFPHAQLYSEPKRLADVGLLKLSEEEGGRRRKSYTITAAGRKALRSWLSEHAEGHFELRDVAEIKLFFNELAGPDDVVRLAQGQIEAHQRRISEYEEIRERYGDVDRVARRMITLELGLGMERAALDFWRGVEDRVRRGEFPVVGER
ncbi:PadR family transcriptional regulator [Streptomyces sp. SID8361]|uniref:PadR family transcriptional regulator n=2 Tax=Streptomyces TaxID=1883 RepID=UPI00081E7FF6|nr:PadR family transcriptional regulator [Streptomyces sp. M56]AUA17191.1 Transcriptional regulator PadR-like family protein [Streptomyces sp. M56]MYU15850.1 PadR family transcriptional regulator [Streptomyces sp. SID8361]MYX56238.1 PadR family transcriptional regulator [Streptomyces sp. SID8382]SCG10397.1 transcriptional regulator, PadR family [Streptomyces sp. MnatMP-M27]